MFTSNHEVKFAQTQTRVVRLFIVSTSTENSGSVPETYSGDRLEMTYGTVRVSALALDGQWSRVSRQSDFMKSVRSRITRIRITRIV